MNIKKTLRDIVVLGFAAVSIAGISRCKEDPKYVTATITAESGSIVEYNKFMENYQKAIVNSTFNCQTKKDLPAEASEAEITPEKNYPPLAQ